MARQLYTYLTNTNNQRLKATLITMKTTRSPGPGGINTKSWQNKFSRNLDKNV